MTRDWIGDFLHSYQAERRSPENTTDNYRFDLEQFKDSLGRRDILTATSRDVAGFIASRLRKGISPISARRQLSSIRSFYGFAMSEGAIECNPARFLRGPKAHRPLVRQITLEEIETAVESIGTESPLDLRNRAMLLMGYGSGLRVSELIKLPASIDLSRDVLHVKRAKNLRDRIVPLNSREKQAIAVYLEKGRSKLLGHYQENGLLFFGRQGEPLTRQRVWQIFGEITKPLLGRNVSPHKFRHAFVTDTVNGGADIRIVQHMAGHAHIGTTMFYMHSDIERIRQEYLKTHPLALRGGFHAA